MKIVREIQKTGESFVIIELILVKTIIDNNNTENYLHVFFSSLNHIKKKKEKKLSL
jgi:hypothetical protein